MTRNKADVNILARQGCRNTRSRSAVVDFLKKSTTPVSAEDIYLAVKSTGCRLNLSTVYRNLELLESKGLVSKTVIIDGKARYELTGDGHRHHLICTNCHKMIPINICPLAKLEKEVGKETDFDITGHKLELYGICPQCKKS